MALLKYLAALLCLCLDVKNMPYWRNTVATNVLDFVCPLGAFLEERDEREEVVDLLFPPLLFTLLIEPLIEVLVARLEDSAMPLARLNKAGK
jgi:hypothetical protein